MKKLGAALRFIALAALIPTALLAGGPQGTEPAADQEMTCAQYCRDVCIFNGETCCYAGPNTCGCC